jgi:hypothetical protein
MDTTIFDFGAERLRHHAELDRLTARGTLRIALKVAGLEPNNLTGAQLRVVFEKVMPGELESRGINNVPDVCAAVLADLSRAGSAAELASATSTDDIFRRLADG